MHSDERAERKFQRIERVLPRDEEETVNTYHGRPERSAGRHLAHPKKRHEIESSSRASATTKMRRSENEQRAGRNVSLRRKRDGSRSGRINAQRSWRLRWTGRRVDVSPKASCEDVE